MTTHLRGALAAIIADPDCCAASKAIARGALREEALTEYGEPRCQPQDTAADAIQALIDNYATAGANLLDWLGAADLTAMPRKRASEQQWRDWGSDVACRATFRALRQAKDVVAAKSDISTDSTTKPVTHYRGWSIHEDRSCPDVGSTFRAFAPDYDPELHNGYTYATAETLGALIVEIDLVIEEAMTQPAPYTCKHGCERDALKDRIAELVKALRAFAAVAEHDIGEDEADSETFRPMATYNRAPTLTVGDLRRARALLARAHTAADTGGE